MTESITLLGTGTCEVRPDRMATSALIQFEDLNVVFDMGRGVTQRLAELQLKNDDIMHVVISHFHPDHVSDLVPFLQCGAWSRVDPRTQDLHLYGPKGLVNLVHGFYEILTREALIGHDHFKVHIHELEAGTFSMLNRKIEYVSLPGAQNHGVLFSLNGTRVGLSGDATEVGPLIEFMKQQDTAVIDSGHLSDQDIIRAAVESQTPRIICSHIYRELDIRFLQAGAQDRGYTGTLIAAHDLMVLQ
jgi:ribonuclease BN (tRNA processing enzyme)